MKLISHYIFSLGALLALAVLLGAGSSALLLVVWNAFAVNWAIDRLGHSSRDGRPVRAWRTHSVFTAPIIGAIIGLAGGLAEQLLYSVGAAIYPGTLALESCGLGVASALAHLLLDSVTEEGVYVVHRVALAHFRYNSVLANGLAMAAGLLLILLAAPHLLH